MNAAWSIDTKNDSVPTLRTNVGGGKELNLLFIGDAHWDHAQCDRSSLKAVLNEALERDSVIILLGDQLCLMGGRDDHRGSKSALRPEHKTDAYFSSVVDDFADWYSPYAKNTWYALTGNHEQAVVKYHEIDPTRMWISRLNAAGASIQYPGYSTYARILVSHNTRRSSIIMFAHHGYGGGGPVTKGVIQSQRRAAMYPDANFIVTGHIHTPYYVPHEQFRLNGAGRPYHAFQEAYSTGTFKDEFGRGEGGWHVERGQGPREKSGWWCRVKATSQRGVRWTFEKAIA